MRELVSTMYAYNDWANARILVSLALALAGRVAARPAQRRRVRRPSRGAEGERWAYPLWQQMVHQVNHGTQHRSEVAMILTRCGYSPGWLDFLYYMDVRAR